MSRFPLFDRSKLDLLPVQVRGHELTWDQCWQLEKPLQKFEHPDLPLLIERIVTARQHGRPVILMMGAHPIKLGLTRFLIDLVERGWLTHVAGNGAVLIHDFELALVGGTSEDVAKWIQVGQFGLWRETSRLNEIIAAAARRDEGMGEAVGRTIESESLPFRHLSLAAAAWRKGIPFTCHAGIGSDIIHAMDNCDGAAVGKASYTDFLIFARAIQELEGGVFLNVGSAVAGPEVYLKALSMARNSAAREGRKISRLTTAVFDLVPLPPDFRSGPPQKSAASYYYRPWKTILVRTIADGGSSFYFCGNHCQTIPTLWHHLLNARTPEVPAS
jgi:hypothetical protein